MAYQPETETTAPPADDFCAPAPPKLIIPVIRFPGGASLVPVLDPSRQPGACGVSLSLVNSLQTALAPLAPIITLLDIVGTLVQIVLVIPEVIGNPFKIAKLLRLIPGLTGKLNNLLSLIPPLPSGAIAFATFVADVLDFAAAQVACVVETLKSVQQELEAIDREVAKSQAVDDADLAARMQALAECQRGVVVERAAGALAVLSPIARIICTVRAILSLVPGGSVIADQIRLPATTDVTDLNAAIAALESVKDGLHGAATAIRSTGLALPGLEDLNYICELDIGTDEAPADPADMPKIARLYSPEIGYATPLASISQAASSDDPDIRLGLFGSGFNEKTAIYFGATRIDQASIATVDPGTGSLFGLVGADQRLEFTLKATDRLNAATIFVLAANGVPSPDYKPPPFSGVGTPPSDSAIKFSEPFEIEIV